MAPADSSNTVGSVPAELSGACAEVTAAGDADVVGGRQAHYVAAPASTAEAAAVLRAAAGLGLTVVARGSGSRLDWAAPPASCDLIIDTRRMDQVLEHAAGDLVVSVQAGVRLDDLAKVLATASQRLALDPPPASALGTSGTVGGLIATGVTGPLRYRYGSPRDLLIGITFVRADGTVAKSGGKVVKNVAGYDIGKLFAGSYGTLGLITEATFRLHPLPETSTWVAIDCTDVSSAAAAVRAIADSPLAPAAIELDWPSAAAPLTVAALLEGDVESVAGRTDRMRTLLGARETAGQPSAHPKRADGRPGCPGTLLRVSFWAGQLTAVLTAVRGAAEATALDPAIGGSAGAGVLEVSVPGEAAVEAVADFVGLVRAGLEALGDGLPPSRASAVVLCAPPAVRDAVDMWGPAPSPALMRAVKDQFDPAHRMAPGRFAGGI